MHLLEAVIRYDEVSGESLVLGEVLANEAERPVNHRRTQPGLTGVCQNAR